MSDTFNEWSKVQNKKLDKLRLKSCLNMIGRICGVCSKEITFNDLYFYDDWVPVQLEVGHWVDVHQSCKHAPFQGVE